jgi:hypothetical protein
MGDGGKVRVCPQRSGGPGVGPYARMPCRVLLVALALAVAACSGSGSGSSGAATSAAATTRTSDPVQVCAGQLRHWGTVLLDAKDVAGYDYQHMALTGTQYIEVLEIAKQAKKVRAREGRAAAVAFIDREATRACRQLAATPCTTSSGAAWPC